MTEQEIRKLKGFLGLCHRAGQVVLGQDACVDAVRRNQAALVMLDEGSSDVSKKRFRNACTSHHVPLYVAPKDLIAQALGKENRMAAAVRPGTMAQKLKDLIREEMITDEKPETDPKEDSADIAGVRA